MRLSARPWLPLATFVAACGGQAVIDDPTATTGSGGTSATSSGSTSTSTSSSSAGTGGTGLVDDPNDPCDVAPPDAQCGPSSPVTHEADTPLPELNIVGIYQSHTEHGFDCHPMGAFELEVTRQGTHVLVLSAYEPVYWVVSVGPDTQLDRILVVGYHDSAVSAPSGVPVEEHTYEGTGDYPGSTPYEWPSSAASQLTSWAEGATGATLTTFHGAYCMSNLTLD